MPLPTKNSFKSIFCNIHVRAGAVGYLFGMKADYTRKVIFCQAKGWKVLNDKSMDLLEELYHCQKAQKYSEK